MPAQHSPTDIGNIQETAMTVVYGVCAIVTLPVEMALRPWYGSEYVSPVTTFLASIMMMVLPLIFWLSEGSFLSGLTPQSMPSLFGLGTFSKLFFIGSVVHGVRVWRRMLNMASEENSYFAGPPLPIFHLVPVSWWTTRIVVEPVFVLLLAFLLQNLFILDGPSAGYLMIAAPCLAMKNYIHWFSQWQVIRHLMNARAVGPIINRLVDNKATDDDLASVHLASFSKNLPEDVRQSAARYIARAFNAEEKEE